MSHLRQSRATLIRHKGRASKSQVWQGVLHVASWRVAQSRDSFSEQNAALFYGVARCVFGARHSCASKTLDKIAGVTSILGFWKTKSLTGARDEASVWGSRDKSSPEGEAVFFVERTLNFDVLFNF